MTDDTSPRPSDQKTRAAWKVPTAVGIVTLLIGIGLGLGLSGTNDSKESASSEPTPPPATSSTGNTAADLDRRESLLDKQAADQSSTQSALDTAFAELDERDAALAAAEKAAEADTIDSDGSYAVGDDIKAGTWKNPDRSESCYWAILGDPNGDDIVANSNGGGPQTVELEDGQFFQLRNECGEWTRRK